MNAFTKIKRFTAVAILMVSVLGWGKAAAPQSRDVCESNCKSNSYSSECINQKANESTCVSNNRSACMADCTPLTYVKEAIENAKQEKLACTAAFEKFSEASADSTAACEAFGKEPNIAKTCEQRVKSCAKKIEGGFDDVPSETTGNSDDDFELIKTIALSQIAKSNPEQGSQGACVEQYDPKTVVDAEKELKREAKELKRDIKKEADKILDLQEKQSEKEVKIKEKITEINKKLKEEKLKEDSEMRKQISDAAKISIDSAKKLRDINMKITAESNKLAQLRFSHQTDMLDLADDRAAFRCKQQLLALKNGILTGSGPGAVDPKSPESSQMRALADQVKNHGTKGTANLRALLAQAQTQCFEKENTKKKQTVLSFNQRQNDLNNSVKELQSQIDDENKQVALSQDNIKKIQEETTRKKTETEEAVLQEISDLNASLAANEKSINAKIKLANDEAARLNSDIQNLVLKTKGEVKAAFRGAQKAISKSQGLREAASESCFCNNSEKRNIKLCDRFDSDEKENGSGLSKGKAKQ